MRAVPVNLVPFINWSQWHAARWVEHAGSIGVPPQQAEGFAEATQALVAARQAEEHARQALVDATSARRRIEQDARQRAAWIIAQVRVFASQPAPDGRETAQEIFGLAGIDAPRDPHALPAPETPWLAGTEMNSSTGHLTLRLAARQPRNSRGTMYQATRIWTDASGQTRREGLPLTATRTLVDATLPAGPREVNYELRAIRSGQESPAAIVTVRLAAA